MILLDTSGLLAAIAGSQRTNAATRLVLESDGGPFVLSPFILAELDYLLTRWSSADDALALMHEVERCTYELAQFDAEDVGRAASVIETYHDLGIGLADASLVVLAERLGTRRILTLDERHFRALRPLDGGHFELLPADA